LFVIATFSTKVCLDSGKYSDYAGKVSTSNKRKICILDEERSPLGKDHSAMEERLVQFN